MIQLRSDVINALIKRFSYRRYLEIGVCKPHHNFNKINVDYKIGVDPDPQSKATLIMTSDQFFSKNKDKFDIIFIDGLHYADQCYKDIINALEQLNNNGSIIVHDCNPASRRAQMIPQQCEDWNGDVWKAWVQIKSERVDLEMFVVNVDEGVGIIKCKAGQSSPLHDKTPAHLNLKMLTYANLRRHRRKWLNLIEVSTFEQWVVRTTIT